MHVSHENELVVGDTFLISSFDVDQAGNVDALTVQLFNYCLESLPVTVLHKTNYVRNQWK